MNNASDENYRLVTCAVDLSEESERLREEIARLREIRESDRTAFDALRARSHTAHAENARLRATLCWLVQACEKRIPYTDQLMGQAANMISDLIEEVGRLRQPISR